MLVFQHSAVCWSKLLFTVQST